MKFPIALFILLLSTACNATFYIDNQGLERKPVVEIKSEQISPNGYRLLTDGLQGLVYEVGNRAAVVNTSSFAEDIEFKYAIGSIIPKGWSVYVDEQLTALKNISFSADNEPWINVLARVGAKHGYKYVVDWSSKIVQVSFDEFFNEPDLNTPVAVQSDDGQLFYIYKTKQPINKGYMIIDGEMIPISIKSNI